MKCKMCNENKSEKNFYKSEKGIDEYCSQCRAKERISSRKNKVKLTKKKEISIKKKISSKEVPCPLCKSTRAVRKVMSHNGKNIIHVNYCRECYIEFENRGVLLSPLYA